RVSIVFIDIAQKLSKLCPITHLPTLLSLSLLLTVVRSRGGCSEYVSNPQLGYEQVSHLISQLETSLSLSQ
uniref:Uncharacterized protein n=1 Tax=Amphimedon queenslandica TaxID=400682 RepID=A0A1X7VM34_AMPQE